ncbi:AraC family transcriptional regulator [Saccharibacillus sp. O23]|uniref:AraC family transcriptional regulator n=1 Tax=Saccharibacillus sp. O23 TaxID=2009338 RepID=UPI000B4E4D5D|nr:AraC family transcriptional regulator [Saccharibacillus sp. O23]OWR31492.1 AraC family transcriptional regulator [Saccharibacillus sp. O23]
MPQDTQDKQHPNAEDRLRDQTESRSIDERNRNGNRELTQLLLRHAPQEGPQTTAIPELRLIRQTGTQLLVHSLYRPSLCIVAQGAKQVVAGKRSYTYDPSSYLATSVELPIQGRVVQASPEAPYLSLQLYFTADQIVRLGGGTAGSEPLGKRVAEPAIGLGRMNEALTEATLRLVRLLDTPKDIEALAPLAVSELLYRALQGELGGMIRRFAASGTSAQRIAGAVRRLQTEYDRTLRVEELAAQANMSESSFYVRFKETTGLTPIQYQKRIRLQEARRLLLSETGEAADAAYRVGYESPSQFGREYARMFGLPPAQDMKRMREALMAWDLRESYRKKDK